MDILWTLLTLPYAPVRGLTAVVKVVAREAEARQYSPVNIRRELEELDRAAAAGEITAEERDRGQQRVLDRLSGAGRSGAGSAGAGAARSERRSTTAGRRRPTADRGRDPARRRAASARREPDRRREE